MISTPSTASSPTFQSEAVGQLPAALGCVSVRAPRMLGYTSTPCSRANSIPTSAGWSWSMYIETRLTEGSTRPSWVGKPAANLDTIRSAWE